MRTVHINTHDITGGAARAASRLHTGLQRIGVDSTYVVLSRRSSDPSVRAFKPPKGFGERVLRRLRAQQIERSYRPYKASRPAGLEVFSDDRTLFGAQLLDGLPPCDLINLHWISGLVDIPAFFRRVTVPVVWTLHDMNAFTGGCHYDAGCGKYQASCGACPQLGSSDENDLSRQVWQRKKEAFGRFQPSWLQIVTPSRWLAGEVERSTLLREFRVSVIPYGLDTSVFAPRDASGVREALGIPVGVPVLLFLADAVSLPRKGLDLLAEALKSLPGHLNPLLLSVGRAGPELRDPLSHIHAGEVKEDWMLSLIYSIADVLVVPSIQDNLPNTILEAFACGTPVVGFDAGGMSDAIRPGKTGWLAPVGDVRALREAIVQALSDREHRSGMAAECRRTALQEYDLELQAARYLELYRELLGESANRPRPPLSAIA